MNQVRLWLTMVKTLLTMLFAQALTLVNYDNYGSYPPSQLRC